VARGRSVDPQERYRRFVADTMAKRIPMIVRNAGEGFDAETVTRLEAISRAISAGAPMVVDLSNWPFQGWEEFPLRVNGRRIGDAPFFDFEFWMYFRILEAVRFSETRADPFRTTKHRDLDRHLKWADEALGRVSTLADALRTSLDANAHDLSQIGSPTGRYELGRDALNVEPGSIKRLNLIADNFGFRPAIHKLVLSTGDLTTVYAGSADSLAAAKSGTIYFRSRSTLYKLASGTATVLAGS